MARLAACWGREVVADRGGGAGVVLLAGVTSPAEVPPEESVAVVPPPAEQPLGSFCCAGGTAKALRYWGILEKLKGLC